MKILFTILFFTVLSANATVYYVSNAGSDAADGITTGTSWQHLSKVNGFTFNANDSILFNCGDTWIEQLFPPRSNLYFGKYGTGLKPVITGLQSVSGFTNTSGNLWSATASSSVKNLNTVLVNGNLCAKGRYPNTGYLTTTNAATTQFKLVVTGLTGSYTGAELVTRGYQYIIDVNKVSSQVVDTLNVYGQFTYAATNYSYFFQNLPAYCHLQNDYAYDSASKLLTLYSVAAPANVQIATIDTLVKFYKKNYLTFENISFTGANNVGIFSDTTNNNTIKNCVVKNIGGYNPKPITMSGIGGSGIRANNSIHMVIQNDSIINCLNNAIFTIYNCDSISIANNYIKNAGYIEGMGSGSNGAGIGIFHNGDSANIINNRIDSVGYVPLFWNGRNALIKNNFITNFTFIKSDGGGIYTGNGSYGGSTGSKVRSNIILNGFGTFQNFIGAGVYLDYNTNGVTVDSNTISNCNYGGLMFNDPFNSIIHDNTIMNGIGDGWNYGPGGGSSFDFKRNIYYITDSTHFVINTNYTTENGGTISVDSNYYLRPLKEALKFAYPNMFSKYSLSGWQALHGWDINSKETPSGITGAGVLYYNATLTATTTALSGRFIDAKGAIYNNQITLQPFQSAILFVSSIQIPKAFGNLIFQ